MIREPTLPLEGVGGFHIGFRSPLLVRLRLWWDGLRGKVQAFETSRMDGVCTKGWVDDSGTTYVTRVWLNEVQFGRITALTPLERTRRLAGQVHRFRTQIRRQGRND